MGKNDKTSPKVATLASKVLKDPSSATNKQIKTLAASVLTQAPDKKKSK
jgi:hypothetical protein